MSRHTQTTDGWRGLPGSNWSEVELLGHISDLSAQDVLGRTVAIGYDGRAGSAELAALAAGLLDRQGHSVLPAGRAVPTPALGRYVWAGAGIDSGLMFTASHNPPGYVGVKVRDARGQGVSFPSILSERFQDFDDLHEVQPRADVLGAYLGDVGTSLRAAVEEFSGRVVVDTAHGTVGAVRQAVTGVVWHRATVLPFFGGLTPDPIIRDQATAVATRAVTAAGAPEHTVVAMTDGDGDRLVLYTRSCGIIDSTDLAVLLSDLLDPVPIIATVVGSRRLSDAARRKGVDLIETDVGFKNIIHAWRENGEPEAIAVEPNGAVVAAGPSDYFERDALVALARILRATGSVEALDAAVRDVRGRCRAPQEQFGVEASIGQVTSHVTQVLSRTPVERLPGVLVWEDDETKVTVRESGTEPIVRVYIEASSQICDTIRELATP